jgi:DNA transposition AAA+ family ATPase
MMTITEKREIQYKLRIYIASFTSQKKASVSISGVSEATFIAMLDENEKLWNGISENMWRMVASHVGGIVNYSKLIETENFKKLSLYFDVAKQEGATFAIVGNGGFGKTYCAKWYTSIHRKRNVILLECAEYWNKKIFCQRILMQIGKSFQGASVGDMMELIIRELRRVEKPLIIMDEVDKLPEQVFKFFITLYNELNGICGFVWLSTDHIEKRMKRGLDKNTTGYQELHSRIGASFIRLSAPTQDEVEEICKANGITDQKEMMTVVNEVKDLHGDLRRVDRNILKSKVKAKRKN